MMCYYKLTYLLDVFGVLGFQVHSYDDVALDEDENKKPVSLKK